MLTTLLSLISILAHPLSVSSQPVKADVAPSPRHAGQTCSSDSYTLVKNDHGIWPYRRYMTTNATSPELLVNGTTPETSDSMLFMTLADTGFYGFDGVKQQGAVILSTDGELVWFGPTGATSNFRKQSLEGEDVITVWTGSGSAAAAAAASHGYGKVNILNAKYETLHTVCPNLDLTLPPGTTASCVADVHESYITEDNTMLVTVYNITRGDLTSVGGPKDGWLTTSIAVEVDIETSEPVFIWDPQDHVPITASHLPLNGAGTNISNTYDWFHMNSIQSVNGGYLINSRQAWTSYFVTKQGDIEWQISGDTGGSFGDLPTGYNFSWEHDARLQPHGEGEGRFLYTCFNDFNGDPTTRNVSSGSGLVLDLSTPGSYSIKPESNLLDANEELYAFAEGSYQVLDNGNALVGYGTVPVMKEFDINTSKVQWTAQFAYNNYNNTASTYRVFKDSWHATPTTPIDLVVGKSSNATIGGCNSGSGMVGYVSWNGATDVTSYGIHGRSQGQDKCHDTGITFDKKGFETMFSIPEDLSHIEVVALVGESVVGKSKEVKV